MKRTLSSLSLVIALALCALPSLASAQPVAPPTGETNAAPASPTAPTNTPASSPQAAAATRTVRARVLTDCEHGKCNDLVALPPDVAKGAMEARLVDTDKGAVAYAASLEQNKPKPKDS